MSKFDSKKTPFEDDPIVFDLEEVVSSGILLKREKSAETDVLELTDLKEGADGQPEEEVSPVYKELASIELPELGRENRARLQMQTPSRLFFYWSMKHNPFQTLHRAFGDTGSYTLGAKLIDLTRDTEEICPVEAEGSSWFSVDSNREYRAEIGFCAPNRPYIRVMYSNTIATPRKRPSPRAATSADWNVTANTFAQVLDVSGFKQDAFEVAFAGDQPQETQPGTYAVFAKFVERDDSDFAGIASGELRYALLLIASGLAVEHLRYRIDASLFALLQASAEKLSAENAATALKEQFGVEADEMIEEEEATSVFGASLINFPRRLKRKRTLPKYEPVSSPVR